MYFAMQSFSLVVTSGKKWLLDLGFRLREIVFLTKTVLNWGICAISSARMLLFFYILKHFYCFILKLGIE